MPAAPGLARTDSRATLTAVADLLGKCGTVEIRFGRLFFEGHEALFVNASRDLVIAARFEGGEVVERARNVTRGTSAAEIVADIVARFGGRKAA